MSNNLPSGAIPTTQKLLSSKQLLSHGILLILGAEMVTRDPSAMTALDTRDANMELAMNPGLAIAKKAGAAFFATKT